MSVFHDEVEIEDFEFDPETDTYYYPCPCGDQFEITRVWENGGRMEGLGKTGGSLAEPDSHTKSFLCESLAPRD